MLNTYTYFYLKNEFLLSTITSLLLKVIIGLYCNLVKNVLKICMIYKNYLLELKFANIFAHYNTKVS